jgi:hypothetical protein
MKNFLSFMKLLFKKKIRKIFEKKYEAYLINEFRTSKICNNCESDVNRFLKKKIKIKK